jgi:hypothetical protein
MRVKNRYPLLVHNSVAFLHKYPNPKKERERVKINIHGSLQKTIISCIGCCKTQLKIKPK